jgi:hypothetical protein
MHFTTIHDLLFTVATVPNHDQKSYLTVSYGRATFTLIMEFLGVAA